MLSVPVGAPYAAQKENRLLRTYFYFGGILGGLFMAIFGAICFKTLDSRTGFSVVAVVGVAAVISSMPGPMRRRWYQYWPARQAAVPRRWVTRYSSRQLVLRYGVFMGTGVLTHLSFPAFYAWLLLVSTAAYVLHAPWLLLPTFAIFGLARTSGADLIVRRLLATAGETFDGRSAALARMTSRLRTLALFSLVLLAAVTLHFHLYYIKGPS